MTTLVRAAPGLVVVVVATAAAATATLAACARPAPLTSCKDPLGGVWQAIADADVPGGAAGAVLAFDVRDRGGALELYPLWDTSRPPGGKTALRGAGDDGAAATAAPLELSPWRLALTRAGDAAVGTVAYRITQQGTPCSVRLDARVHGCSAHAARLDVDLATTVDAATCAQSTPPRRVSFALTR